jgi:O-glycosyl hydrolase
MDSINFILNTSGKKYSVSLRQYQFSSQFSTASYFNLNHTEKTSDDSYVRDFLENDSQRVLSASLNDTRKSIQFQNKIPNDYQNVLLFYKNQKSTSQVESSQQSDLGMITLEGGLVKSIYNSLSSIFVPNAVNVSINVAFELNYV